jgi:hypothetical protein
MPVFPAVGILEAAAIRSVSRPTDSIDQRHCITLMCCLMAAKFL